MTIIAPTTDITPEVEPIPFREPISQVAPSVIADYFDEIDNVPSGHYVFADADDPLYQDYGDRCASPKELFRAGVDLVASEDHYFADFYARDGHRLTLAERPDGWYEQQSEIRDPGRLRFDSNVTTRLGDDTLMVGRGQWIIEHVADDHVIVVSYQSLLKAQLEAERLAKAAFLAEHPALAMPAWAEDVNVELPDHSQDERDGIAPDVVDRLHLAEVTYSRMFGHYDVMQIVQYDPATGSVDAGPIKLMDQDGISIGSADARRESQNALAAAEFFDSIVGRG